MCGKMSFVFGLLIAIVVFSSASIGGLYIHPMGDEEYDIIKDFFTGNFIVPVADQTEHDYKRVKFWRLRKGLLNPNKAGLFEGGRRGGGG